MQFQRFPLLLLVLLLVVVSPAAGRVRWGGTPSSSARQHSRVLEFFCFLGAADCEDTGSSTNNATTTTDNNNNGGGGDWCVPLMGPCPEGTTDNRNYTDCENRTDGLFGGRPIFGDCGYVTEVVDGVVGSTDTDGDGRTDAVQLDLPDSIEEFFAGGDDDDDETDAGNGTSTRSSSTTTTPKSHGWLQLFPEGSLMWDIFGPEADANSTANATAEVTGFLDNAIDTLFGDRDGFLEPSLQFSSDWEPTYGNGTCLALPNTTNAGTVVGNNTSTTPPVASMEYNACRTTLGRDGFYVCRTLYNPYTGIPQDKTLCIDHGENEDEDQQQQNRKRMMVPNDACGCCDGVCPEDLIEEQCQCRCDLNGINDGLLIVSNRLASSKCVSREDGIATVGQQLDVQCSTACLDSPAVSTETPPSLAGGSVLTEEEEDALAGGSVLTEEEDDTLAAGAELTEEEEEDDALAGGTVLTEEDLVTERPNTTTSPTATPVTEGTDVDINATAASDAPLP